MPHSSIDWNDTNHITKINNWRNQIYGRAGLKSKEVTMWLPDEELWFELYFQLSIAESRARGILLPKTSSILHAFNQTFVGHTLQDTNGNHIGPRSERKHNAFASKFNRMCPHLRARLQQCIFGKSGDVFVPEITVQMLEAYKAMKMEMSEKGIEKESEYSDHLKEWRQLFSHLPGVGDVPFTTDEDDAAAVLMSMATSASSYASQQSHDPPIMSSTGHHKLGALADVTSYYTNVSHANKEGRVFITPELFCSAVSCSTEIAYPLTPTCTFHSPDKSQCSSTNFEHFNRRPTTALYGLDMASLIASPD
ncbi:hypothetical protein ACEQ8H_008742 [Pleosporales sp. CAS-2024a]